MLKDIQILFEKKDEGHKVLRKRIFAAEVKIIPQPLPVIGMVRDRDRPFFKNGRILIPNIGWNHLHKRLNTQRN